MTKTKKPLIIGHMYEYFRNGESRGKIIFVNFSSNTTSTVRRVGEKETFKVKTYELEPIDSIVR